MPTRHLLIPLAVCLTAGFATAASAPAQENLAAEMATPLIKAAQIASLARTDRPALRSSAVMVLDAHEDVMLYGQNIDTARPIASLTKLMTAMVILDAELPLDLPITIDDADRDRLRGTHSRLAVGDTYMLRDLLLATLAASENRAAAALIRSYPGGTEAGLAAMNAKAAELGMTHTRFRDASGLHRGNVSTAHDLARLALAAGRYPLIAAFTTTNAFEVTELGNGERISYYNTNRLVYNDAWQIDLSKTGFTSDAGNCLVMQTTIAGRPVVLVLLNSWGKLSKYGDSQRIRDWLLGIERRLQVAGGALRQS